MQMIISINCTTVPLHDVEVVTILDTGWRCSPLLNLTIIPYSPTFLSLSFFVSVYAFPHVFVIVFVFSFSIMTSRTISQIFLWHPRIGLDSGIRMEGGVGFIFLVYQRSCQNQISRISLDQIVLVSLAIE